ncbi:MAG: amino acid adenylation domain-containing protein [Terriglobales bacterium]
MNRISPSTQEFTSLPQSPENTRSDLGEEQAFQRCAAHWNRYLSAASALSLPTDRPRPANPTLHIVGKSSPLSTDLRDSLRYFSEMEQIPLPVVFLSAFQVLLARYTLQEEVVMGCSILGPITAVDDVSRDTEREFIVGVNLADDPSFRHFLKRVNREVLESLVHGAVPLQRLAVELSPGAQTPISQVSFSYRTLNSEAKGSQPGGIIPETLSPLHFAVEQSNDQLLLSVFYGTELFEAESMNRTLRNMQTLLHGIVQDPDQVLSKLPLLTNDEARKILVQWNQTACDYPHKCLHELVEAQAELVPENSAVVCGNQQLTYREFNTRANQLAHYLRSRGVRANARVGICLNPSLDFAVAVLGVLKAGGVCVPLDPNYPAERLSYMLRDVKAQVLVTESGILADGNLGGCEVLYLANHSRILSDEPHTNPASEVTPDNIAYVIYTSGSTGKPRGVLLAHAGLVNYIATMTRMYAVTPSDRVLQFCSISFDIAVEELFVAWSGGAALVFKSEDTPLAVPDFLAWAEEQHVTVLDLPTAYWHEWVNQIPELEKPVPQGLRLVIVGGEKASAAAYAKWSSSVVPKVRWINTYGPTEASIAVTAFEPNFAAGCPIPENIPIGRPLANTRVYLLDRHLQPVPVGIPGELHIGGAGVARGYLDRPELTAQKFISDPFSSDPNARLYKTGDLARFLPSGEIEFLGRGDDQVKIRGFRIELGEIESALVKHGSIREAAVIARASDGARDDKQLVAYLVPAPGPEPRVAELRSYLEQHLPDYMVPSAFVVLQRMPMTPNGKIDRRGLPAPPARISSREEVVVITDAFQSELVKIWEEVLARKPIAIRDNFFELGGHSLLAARLMHRIGQALGKTLPLAMLFQAPTIEQLAVVLRQDEWSRHWSSLVPIQTVGSQPPFFCIHGVGGNVVGFYELGRHMGPDYPFYGLQSQGLDGKHPCHARVEEMAAHYLSEIRTVQPKGPYFFGGFSFGGLVAYEMAQQLRAAGEEVGLVVLFDTYPGNLKPVTTSFIKLLLQPSRQHLLHDLPKAARKKIHRTFLGLRVPRLLKHVRSSNKNAADHYILKPYNGKATLLRATEVSLRSMDDPHAAWSGLVGSLEIRDIPSDHYGILVEPQVGQLAQTLKDCIDQARSEFEQPKTTLQVS